MGAFASSDGAVAAFSQDHGTGLNDKTFSLCPGWFAMRSPCAGRAQSFVAAWRGLTDKDDQVAVNKLYGLQLARRTRGLAADHSVAVLGYGAFQRCDAAHKPPRGEVKVWHPWLDCAAFSVAEKVNVWRPVLAELNVGDSSVLDAFYDTSRVVSLTPRVHADLLRRRAHARRPQPQIPSPSPTAPATDPRGGD
ncbi:hypothetical protein M885DRAFT_508320 [Pelagophyceae sp. CCMP2097]|nr:hypothetical protein M885DRAFT_508320 [Pelagophyceae sp. CCMP2097]